MYCYLFHRCRLHSRSIIHAVSFIHVYAHKASWASNSGQTTTRVTTRVFPSFDFVFRSKALPRSKTWSTRIDAGERSAQAMFVTTAVEQLPLPVLPKTNPGTTGGRRRENDWYWSIDAVTLRYPKGCIREGYAGCTQFSPIENNNMSHTPYRVNSLPLRSLDPRGAHLYMHYVITSRNNYIAYCQRVCMRCIMK